MKNIMKNMSKKQKILLSVLVGLVVVVLGVFLYQDHLYSDTLPDARRQKALTAFARNDLADPAAYKDTEPDKVAGRTYLGTFNGYDIFYSPGGMMWTERKQIAGEEFAATTSFTLYAHKNYKLIFLEDAYEQGLLSARDISKIAKSYRSRDDIYGNDGKW